MLLKWALAILAPFLPGLPFAIGAYYFGNFLDKHLKPKIRADFIEYLRKGRIREDSHVVVDTAADAMNVVFGPRHFSWRCFIVSAAMTFCSIVFFLALSGIFAFWLRASLTGQLRDFIEAYWLGAPLVRLRASITWLLWSIVVDYLSLYKTRIVIRILRKRVTWGPLICVADFAIGFMIYIASIFFLSILPLLLKTSFILPPMISLELQLAITYSMILWFKFSVAGLDTLALAHGIRPELVAAILQGNVPQIMLGMAFLVQLIPFLTIGSNLFYAAMAPSIWLWVFVAAVFIAKALNGIGAYLQYALSSFRKPRRTLAVTGGLLTPVIIALFYLGAFMPYLAAFAVEAVLGLVGHLSSQLPRTMLPPQ